MSDNTRQVVHPLIILEDVGPDNHLCFTSGALPLHIHSNYDQTNLEGKCLAHDVAT